ncbi:MAG: hypothetical protein NC118_05590, partial [Eubacterium sp.]|nr:hypothetical protein [Eubacterium sp.]
MSSSEEYLENLLQSMMNGEVASPSEQELNDPDRQKSAIAMLSGEEPEPVLPVRNAGGKEASSSTGMEDMEAMLAEMVANLDESEDGMMTEGSIMDDTATSDEPEELSLDDLGIDDLLSEESGIDDLALEEPGMNNLAEEGISGEMPAEETG